MCQWYRSDGSRLSAAEYSYGKLHGLQTWYKADGISIDYVEKYWNGARSRSDVDSVTRGSGSLGVGIARGAKWTELEREQVKVKSCDIPHASLIQSACTSAFFAMPASQFVVFILP
jgi:hypothetical protein